MRLRRVFVLFAVAVIAIASTACEPDDSGSGGGLQKPDYIEDELNQGSQDPDK